MNAILSTNEPKRDFAPKPLCGNFCKNRSKLTVAITVSGHTHPDTQTNMFR